MSVVIVVGTGEGGDGAAAREVAALSQGTSPQQQRNLEQQIEQATRERVQAALEARATAREAALNAQAAGQGPQAAQVVQVPALPAPPAPPTSPRVVITRPDGRQVIINGSGVQHATSAAQGGVPPDVQVAMPDIPAAMVVMVIAFFVTLAFIAVGLPLARAFARRMDRQSGGVGGGAAFPSDVSDRIERIEHAVEAIAIEVERVSEGQRFTTKLLSEMRAPAPLSAGSPAGNAYAGEGR